MFATGPLHTAADTTLQASEGREAKEEASEDQKRPTESADGLAEAEADADTNKQRFKHWLLLLLFQLLLMITQVGIHASKFQLRNASLTADSLPTAEKPLQSDGAVGFFPSKQTVRVAFLGPTDCLKASVHKRT